METIKETRGRKAYKPTDEKREIVKLNSGYGLPKKMIATIIGCNEKTLEKYYQDEIRLGESIACSAVAGALFKKCMEGDTASILFWHKTRMGFRETGQDIKDDETPEPKQIIFNVVDARSKPSTE